MPALQALSLKEAAALRSDLEDARQALERIRAHYADVEASKDRDVARLKVRVRRGLRGRSCLAVV